MSIENYIASLKSEIDKLYFIANEAKRAGKDVKLEVESKPASDKNNRCIDILDIVHPELKIHRKEIISRILELEKEYGVGSDEVVLEIAKEIATEKFFKFNSREEAILCGLRFGCAYNTKGVVGAPIEGLTKVKIDPKDNFLYVYYAGPIRAAGGTAQVFTLFIADYIRKALGIGRYKPTKEEIERYYAEIVDYIEHVTRKQYRPNKEEVEFLVKNVPICITGEPTEKREVSKYKDLERAETTRIRGGVCLIYLDGLPLKAEKLLKKLKKYGDKFGLTDSWGWLEDFIKLKKSKEKKGEERYKFLEEVPAGRPVYSMPTLKGGFRLRYGRSRNTGIGCFGFNPATLEILDSFPAIGSQMKIELPGKSCTVAVCDYIEPPIVRLKNGNVIRVDSRSKAREIKDQIDRILFVGDILISYGDFAENGERLIKSPYVEEWWVLELEEKKEAAYKILGKERVEQLIKNPKEITEEEAIKLTKILPLHPRFIYFYDGFDSKELAELIKYLNSGEIKDDKLILKNDSRKELLEKACILHEVSIDKEFLILEEYLSLLKTFEGVNLEEIRKSNLKGYELVNKFSKLEIRDKVTKYIGARMGRPEKSEARKMKGSPQILFPVGEKGGRMRNLVEVDYITTEISEFHCDKHGSSILPYCLICGKHLENPRRVKKRINVIGLLNEAYKNLGENRLPLIKGVRGITSKHKVPEPIEKGILRAKHGLYVFRDGTIRFDMVNAPLTHFKPKEIGTSIEKLKELGYTHDIYGKPLENEEQILELFPQDIIISTFGEESAADYFLSVAKFVDEELEKFYGVKRFYNAKKKEDLIGHLFLDIAPHTISPVVCRLIGFTPNRCHYAHPYLFAGTRRDCDGEENGLMLMLDCLLNFSKEYLPEKRGSISDAPLSITTILDLEEVDDEVYDMDIAFKYSKEFYEKSALNMYPWEIKIEQVGDRLEKGERYRNLGYTIETNDINAGVHITKYKEAGDMVDKVISQLELARKLNSVDEKLVAYKILSSHFLKDLKGNLRTFFKQTIRCTSCNSIYRRAPLKGRCLKCNGNLVLTVSEGTISKYLEVGKKIAYEFSLPNYVKEQLALLQLQLENIFGKKARQSSLAAFS
jgi:DNA polymerase II large subunit